MGKSWNGNAARSQGQQKYDAEPAGGERAPLEWQEVHSEMVGSVKVAISAAMGSRGNKLYSFALGRMVTEGRTSKFFQPRDLDSLSQAVEVARKWLASEAAT